jgi:ketosteroid isomerase-like protein
MAPVDDVYAINLAKSNYREGFDTTDVERVLSAFAPEFTDMSDARPTRYRADAAAKLRRSLAQLFAEYEAKLNVIIMAISVFGNNAFDYGWHELTLKPRNGGEPVYRRTRYCELWSKQANGDWKISKFMDNIDVPDIVD